MKVIKKLLYIILGLLSLISLFIIICAFQPELADKVSDFLYDKRPERLVVADRDTDSGTVNEATEGAGYQEPGQPERTAEPTPGYSEADTTAGLLPVDTEDYMAGDYIAPEKSEVSAPEELSGRGGYVPVREENEQVDEEEAERLREQYTYGETGENLTFDTQYYPYYGMLDDNLKKLYRQIYANAMAVNGSFNPVTQAGPEQIKNVFMAVLGDHPELFWLESAYNGRFAGNGECVQISLVFNELTDNLEAAKNEFNSAADEILSGAQNAGSDYEKEVYVHNALLNQITYDLQSPLNQSAYSALVRGRTVCAGYARAFQYLMTKLGIPCYYCTGYAGQNHAWNMIRLDGEFYNVDTTWDDTDPNTWDYFNKSDADFAPTHMREDLSVYLPACNGSAYSNLETNPLPEATPEEDSRRTLEETGFTEGSVLTTLEDYYNDCYRQIMANNGSGEFWNIVSDENLWLQFYQAYHDDSYSAAYMDAVLTELQATGCEVNIEAEPLKDGKYLLHHSINFF